MAAYPRRGARDYLAWICLVLVILSLQAIHFSGRPYDRNEDWAVQWSRAGLPDDNPPFRVWSRLVGDAPPVVRYFSALWSLLGLAALYRLGRAAWGGVGGLLAVFFLGMLMIFQFFGYQAAQPTAVLLATTTLAHLAFWRWLRDPRWRVGILYITSIALAVYTYPFAIFVVIGHAVFAGVFCPGQRWQAIGLGTPAYVLALLRLSTLGGEDAAFAAWRVWELLRIPLPLDAPHYGQILVLIGLAGAAKLMTAAQPLGTAEGHWRVHYPLTLVVVGLALNTLTSSGALRPDNLLLLLPVLAWLAAGTAQALPGWLRGGLLVIFVLPTLFAPSGLFPWLPYSALLERLQANPTSRLVVVAPYGWQHLPIAQAGSDRAFHIVSPTQTPFLAPQGSWATGADQPGLERFSAFLGDAPEVWVFENRDTGFKAAFLQSLTERYRTAPESARPRPALDFFEGLARYIRIPDNLRDQFVYGQVLALQAWRLQNDVRARACQTITLQSWWALHTQTYQDYSMTLVLATTSDGQGVARTDGWPTHVPTSTLAIKRPYVDERTLTLPCDLKPGEYPLLVGIYRVVGDAAQPLPAALADGSPLGNLVYLTTLYVEQP